MGSEFADTIIARADVVDTRIDAGGGDDRVRSGGVDSSVTGGDGDDRILGGRGRDFVMGDDGDDVLDGAAGNDLLEGNRGNDTMIGGDSDDLFIDFEPGTNVFDGGHGNDGFSAGAGASANRVTTGSGTDNLFVVVSGNAGALTVTDWSSGKDVLDAGYRIGDDFRFWSAHDLDGNGPLGADDLGFARIGQDLVFDVSSVTALPANPTIVWHGTATVDFLLA